MYLPKADWHINGSEDTRRHECVGNNIKNH